MSEPLPYHVIYQNKLQGRSLDNWSARDIVVGVICMLLVTLALVWAWMSYSSLVGFALGFVVLMCVLPLVVRMNGGHSYGRGYRQISLIISSLYRRTAKEGVWWRAQQAENSKRTARRTRSRTRRPPCIPLRIEVIDTKDLDGNPFLLSLVHHLDKPYDQLYIKCTGGDFSNQDINGQNARVQQLADIVNRTLSMSELRVGVAYLRVTSPMNEYPHLEYMLNNGNPGVFASEQFAMDDEQREFAEWLNRYNGQLMPTARAYGAADEWPLIVLTIRRRKEWRGIGKGKVNDENLYNLPVARLGRVLVRDLQQSTFLGFSDVHILKHHELVALMRASWDVFGIDSFNRAYSSILLRHRKSEGDERRKGTNGWQNHTVEYDEEALRHDLEANLSWWPEEVIESPYDDCIRMDGNWLTVLRTTRLPEQVRADEYLSLQSILPAGNDVWMRTYSGGEAISGERQTMQLMVEQAGLINVHDLFFARTLVKHPGFSRKKAALEQQTQAISASSIAQFSNEYRVLVGRDWPTLRDKRDEVIAYLHAHGFGVETVGLLSLQLDAVLTGALGASRL